MPATKSKHGLRILSQQHWRQWRRNPIVQARGRLIHPGTLGSFEREVCGWMRHRFRKVAGAAAGRPYQNRFENLSLFFLDKDTNNALALEDGERRGIGIYIGMPRKLWALIRLAVGQSPFLSKSLDGAPPERGFDPTDENAWASLYAIPDDWPEERLYTLYEIFLYAVEFIVSHEMAHHARKHFEHLRDRFGPMAIDEAMSLQASQDTAEGRLLQMLEFDADHYAIELMLRQQMKDGGDRFSVDEAADDALKMMLSAILVFVAFDLEHGDVDTGYQRSHPAPVHRAMRLTSAIFATYEHVFRIPESRLVDTHAIAWTEVAELTEVLRMHASRWWGPKRLTVYTRRLKELEEDYFAFVEELDRLSDRKQ